MKALESAVEKSVGYLVWARKLVFSLTQHQGRASQELATNND